MDTGFANKVVAITGGASGIGAATAIAFLREGCRVAICGRNKSKLDFFSSQVGILGHDILTMQADVTDAKSLELFAAEISRVYGGIDVWVNNAGIEHYVPLIACSEEDWNEVIDVDLTGVFRGSKAAIPYLKEKKGSSIINLSSFCSQIPTAKNGAYSVAKAGVNALTKVLAAELAPYGIRVNSVIPGFIQTDMTVDQIGTIADQLLEPIAMKRFGKPEEIADAIVFLASRQASYITGHGLVVSGGKYLVQNPQDPWNGYQGGY